MDSETSPILIGPFNPDLSVLIDRQVERAGRFLLVLMWVMGFGLYCISPELTIAHFSITGGVDFLERRSELLVMPSLITGLFIFISRINQYAFGFWKHSVIKGRKNILFYLLIRKSLHIFKSTMPIYSICAHFTCVLVMLGYFKTPGFYIIILNLLISIPFLYYFFQSLRFIKD